jgi:hypothetical protein
MTKKVKVLECWTCGRELSKRDEIISIATKRGTTALFHATAEGCSKANTISSKAVGYRQVPSHSQLQLATLSLSKWDE